jgi:hypothetical protein
MNETICCACMKLACECDCPVFVPESEECVEDEKRTEKERKDTIPCIESD